MERILIGIDALRPSWESLLRAMCLGARIQSLVSVLVVFPPGQAWQESPLSGVLQRVESEISSAKTAGANVELCVSEGCFEMELIRAARSLKTTLLVASPASPSEPGGERESERLGKILGSLNCRVELVSAKKHRQSKKDVK